jgi:hypothetical protein
MMIDNIDKHLGSLIQVVKATALASHDRFDRDGKRLPGAAIRHGYWTGALAELEKAGEAIRAAISIERM